MIKAYYDEERFEHLLGEYFGDAIMLDSNFRPCAKTFLVSTALSVTPPQPQIWRNYEYQVGFVTLKIMTLTFRLCSHPSRAKPHH